MLQTALLPWEPANSLRHGSYQNIPTACFYAAEKEKKNNNTAGKERDRSKEALHAYEKKNWFCHNRLDNYGSSIH